MKIEKYFDDFNELLSESVKDPVHQKGLEAAIKVLKKTKKDNKKIILIGNGGSAAIAEHMAIDLTKNAKLRAVSFSGTPQLTTFANDYGYEYIYSKAIEAYANSGDVVIAISSGGESINILNAADTAQKMGCSVITFSAFEEKNSLRSKGNINFYVKSKAYGYVEIIHNLLVHYISDSIIGAVVYKIH